MKKILVILLAAAMTVPFAACSAQQQSGNNSGQPETAAAQTETKSAQTETDRETIYQVALLQSLTQGYYDGIIKVSELKEHGDTGLGTFEHVDGEMIILDGVCYQAKDDGSIVRSEDAAGVPFAVSGFVRDGRSFEIDELPNLETIKEELTLRIAEDFGLNSIHIARIDGWFEKIHARRSSLSFTARFPEKYPFKNAEGLLF